MNDTNNINKFGKVEFTMPKETAVEKSVRLEEMTHSLLTLIHEVKAAVSLTDDPLIKDQLHTVVGSLNNVRDKVEQAKQ